MSTVPSSAQNINDGLRLQPLPRPPSDLKAAAVHYASIGIPVFPCRPENKRPLTEHGFKDATTSSEQVERWWSQHPNAMIGMPTGAASGIVVVDLDVRADGSGLDQLPDWALRSPIISITPSGGAHLYFARGSQEI